MMRDLEPVTLGPITRHMLALYCGASGDHNPLHTDIDFARGRGGLADVIGHGMLSMSLAGRLVSAAARPEDIRSFGVRFLGKTFIGDELVATGVATDAPDGATSTIVLRVETLDGRPILSGTAIIAGPGPRSSKTMDRG